MHRNTHAKYACKKTQLKCPIDLHVNTHHWGTWCVVVFFTHITLMCYVTFHAQKMRKKKGCGLAPLVGANTCPKTLRNPQEERSKYSEDNWGCSSDFCRILYDVFFWRQNMPCGASPSQPNVGIKRSKDAPDLLNSMSHCDEFGTL